MNWRAFGAFGMSVGVLLVIVAVAAITNKGAEQYEIPSSAALSAELQDQSELFVVLAEHFPESFTDLVSQIREVSPDGESAAEQVSEAYMTEFRLSHADDLMAATDDALATYISAMAGTHRVVLDALGQEVCNQFAVGGVPALGGMLMDPAIFPQIDKQTASMIRAMASAEGRAPRPLATDADWTSFVNSLEGAPEAASYLPLVSASQVNHPNYCSAIIWFIDAVSTAQGEAGERVKASFAREIAAS